MFILYVDESGDPGKYNGKNSEHYMLSGLIVSFDDWKEYLNRLKIFRKMLKVNYSFLLNTEIHASELIRINKNDAYRNIKKSIRIEILKETAYQIPQIFNKSKIINISIKKIEHPNFEEYQSLAWSRIIQRYDTFLKKRGFSKGIIISDDTDEPLIRKLLRKMRVYNPIPSRYNSKGYRDLPTDNIIEDIFLRNSSHSYFIQMVDTIVHLLYRSEYPKGSLRKYGIENLFSNFDSLLLKEASGIDPSGIVRK